MVRWNNKCNGGGGAKRRTFWSVRQGVGVVKNNGRERFDTAGVSCYTSALCARGGVSWADSSVVERLSYKQVVGGSNPSPPIQKFFDSLFDAWYAVGVPLPSPDAVAASAEV